MSYVMKHARGAAAAVREVEYDGRTHLVVPVVALVGDVVINPLGAMGAELVPTEQIAFAPSGWDGRPVVLDHPVDQNSGTPLSANRPEALAAARIGTMFNTRFEDGRLKTEAWIDTTAPAARELVEQLRAGEMVEVSVGAFVAVDHRPGRTADGRDFEWVWSSVVPDHLAVGLSGAKGACSIEMGCGAPRAAAENSSEPDAVEERQPAEATAVRAADCGCGAPKSGEESGKGEGRVTPAPEQGEKKMPSEKQKALAGRLIACGKSPFQEADREVLEAFPEERLESLADGFANAPAPDPVTPPATETATATEPEKPKTEEELIAALPESVRSMIARYQAEERQKRTELVSCIAGMQTVFTEDQLKTKATEELQALKSALETVAQRAAAEAVGVDPNDADAMADYTGRALPLTRAAADGKSADGDTNLPDSWGLAALEASRKGAGEQHKKGTN